MSAIELFIILVSPMFHLPFEHTFIYMVIILYFLTAGNWLAAFFQRKKLNIMLGLILGYLTAFIESLVLYIFIKA